MAHQLSLSERCQAVKEALGPYQTIGEALQDYHNPPPRFAGYAEYQPASTPSDFIVTNVKVSRTSKVSMEARRVAQSDNITDLMAAQINTWCELDAQIQRIVYGLPLPYAISDRLNVMSTEAAVASDYDKCYGSVMNCVLDMVQMSFPDDSGWSLVSIPEYSRRWDKPYEPLRRHHKLSNKTKTRLNVPESFKQKNGARFVRLDRGYFLRQTFKGAKDVDDYCFLSVEHKDALHFLMKHIVDSFIGPDRIHETRTTNVEQGSNHSRDIICHVKQVGGYCHVFRSRYTILYDGNILIFVIFDEMNFVDSIDRDTKLLCGDGAIVSALEVRKEKRSKVLKTLANFLWKALRAKLDILPEAHELDTILDNIVADLDLDAILGSDDSQ